MTSPGETAMDPQLAADDEDMLDGAPVPAGPSLTEDPQPAAPPWHSDAIPMPAAPSMAWHSGAIPMPGATAEPEAVSHDEPEHFVIHAVPADEPEPIHDSAVPDFAVPDSAVPDSGVLDSGVLDPGVLDSAVPGSAVPDSPVLDSPVLDSAVPDSAVPDSAVADSDVLDSAVPDSAVADSDVLDSAVPDSAVADSAAVDSAVPDSAVPDSPILDSTVPDSAAASAADGPNTRWREVQAMFVDDPRSSVESAASLVDDSVEALVAFVREQQGSLLAAWHGEDAGTEEMRAAVQHYRAFDTRLADFRREA
jgi:hypothetical protein